MTKFNSDKRAVLAGRIAFSENSRIEMGIDGITDMDAKV